MRISDSVLHGSCMMAPVMWDGGLLVKSTTGLNFVVQSYDVRSRRAVSQCGVSDSKVGRVIDPEEQADRLSVPTDWRQPPLLLSPFLSRSGTPSIECTIDSREHDLRVVCATDQSTRPKIDMTSGHSIWKMPKVREQSLEICPRMHLLPAQSCFIIFRSLRMNPHCVGTILWTQMFAERSTESRRAKSTCTLLVTGTTEGITFELFSGGSQWR